MLSINALSVDITNNEMSIINWYDNTIRFYPRGATGNIAPIRKIIMSSSSYLNPYDIVIDKINDEIFIVNTWINSVYIFPRTFNGNGYPTRNISGGLPYSGASGRLGQDRPRSG